MILLSIYDKSIDNIRVWVSLGILTAQTKYRMLFLISPVKCLKYIRRHKVLTNILKKISLFFTDDLMLALE